jgi:pyruvate dehydrogenase E2 component (dihydrolipoamide acetyltransferase)
MQTDTPTAGAYDYSLFGAVESKPLSRIRQVISKRLTASWVTVPHVNQFDDVDLTALEALRQERLSDVPVPQTKLALLPFVIKACSQALLAFPEFNASLDASGTNLVLKKYCHIAFAADTPIGLMAPVIRDVDRKSVAEIAESVNTLAIKAKAGRLAMSDAEGACFTVTNLGTVGGSGFTPIINAPEMGVLGVARARRMLVEVEGAFVPRLMLPVCLVYDHRVIDGVLGGRFMAFVRARLESPTSFGLA